MAVRQGIFRSGSQPFFIGHKRQDDFPVFIGFPVHNYRIGI